MQSLYFLVLFLGLIEVKGAEVFAYNKLHGSGSSLLCECFRDLGQTYEAASGVVLEYDCAGSSHGHDEILKRQGSFAITDTPFTEAEHLAVPGLQVAPLIASPLAVIFNLNVEAQLLITLPVLSDILSGNIRSWNDTNLSSLQHNRNAKILENLDSDVTVILRNNPCGANRVLESAFSRNGVVFEGFEGSTANIVYASSTEEMITLVQAIPHSIGYAGASAEVLSGIQFFRVARGDVGETAAFEQSYYPGLRDAELSLLDVTLNASMVGEVSGRLGYPLVGLMYLAFVKQAVQEVCATIDFLFWVFSGNFPDAIFKSHGFVPLTDSMKNQVVGKLAFALCPHRLISPIRIAVGSSMASTVSHLNGVGYAFNMRSATQNKFILVESEQKGNEIATLSASAIGTTSTVETSLFSVASSPLSAATLVVFGEDDISLYPEPEYVVLPLWCELLAIVVNIGSPASSVDVALSDLSEIFSGKQKTWSSLRTHNRFLASQNSTLKHITGASRTPHRTISSRLGIVYDASSFNFHTILDTNDEAAVSEAILNTIGSVGIVRLSTAKTHGLTVVTPLTTVGSTLVTLHSEDFEGTMQQAFTVTKDGTVERTEEGIYPFYSVSYIAVRREVPRHSLLYPNTVEGKLAQQVDTEALSEGWALSSDLALNALFAAEGVFTLHANGTSSGEACDVNHALFVEWLFANSSVRSLVQSYGLFHFAPKGLYTAGIKELQCDGAYVFPSPVASQDEKSYTYLYLVVGACCTAVVLTLLGYLAYSWHVERIRYQSVFGVTVLAAELAEAVCILDFRELEKLKQIKNPNRIQFAMRTIYLMMKEFVKYIPRQVIKAVRQNADQTTQSIRDAVNTTQTSSSQCFETPDTGVFPLETFRTPMSADLGPEAHLCGLPASGTSFTLREVSEQGSPLPPETITAPSPSSTPNTEDVRNGLTDSEGSKNDHPSQGTTTPPLDKSDVSVALPSASKRVVTAHPLLRLPEREKEGHVVTVEEDVEASTDARLKPRRLSSQPQPQPRMHQSPGINLLDTATRDVGVLVVRMHLPSHLAKLAINQVHSAFLENVLWCVEHCNGVVHAISEDSIVSTWGCMGSKIVKKEQFQAAMSIVEHAELRGPRPHMGIHYLKASCGAIGTSEFKAFHVLGGVVEEAGHLARIAELTRAPCLVKKEVVSESLRQSFYLANFFQATSALGRAPFEVNAVLGSRKESSPRRCENVATTLELLVNEHGNPKVRLDLEKVQTEEDFLSGLVSWMSHVVSTDALVGMDYVLLEPGNAGTLYTLQGHAISREHEHLYGVTGGTPHTNMISAGSIHGSASEFSLPSSGSVGGGGRRGSAMVVRRASHSSGVSENADKRSTALHDARANKVKRRNGNVTVKFTQKGGDPR